VNFARGGKDELFRHAFDPIQHAGDLGRAGLLAIGRPGKGGQREFDQTGVHGGDPRVLPAHLFDVWAVVLQDHHPGFDHLIEIAMPQGVRQSVAGNSPAQGFLSFL
jgi:hypothetical protein